MAEAIKVVLRCRPFSKKEKEGGYERTVKCDHAQATVFVYKPSGSSKGGAAGNTRRTLTTVDPSTLTDADIPLVQCKPNETPKQFWYDSVFDWDSKQLDVYNMTARPIVDSVLEGYNGTIFAYGQTGTGKSWTMEGDRSQPELRGIIPNAFEHIFYAIQTARTGDIEFLVQASYLEIYNEQIFDLLDQSGQRTVLKTREGGKVPGLIQKAVNSIEELDKLMTIGAANRATAATEMNDRSSRSHSIFTVTVERSEQSPADGQRHVRMGKLNLVDLAGSERQSKTHAVGKQLKEGNAINQSLMTLSRVIAHLIDKASHVPYRDSVLTHLLSDSLGGTAKTLMLATISPATYNYEETVQTLSYADRVKLIKNKPKINEDPKDAKLKGMVDQIKRLKEQLEALEKGEFPGGEEEEEIEYEELDADGQVKITKQTRKRITAAGPASPKKSHHDAAKIAELQAQIEEERTALINATNMSEHEKMRLLQELETRAAELTKEKQAIDALAAQLKEMESQIMSGGVNLLDKSKEQEQILAHRAMELEEKRRQEIELQRQLQQAEESALQEEESYASLHDEAVGKTKKLQRLWQLLMTLKREREDTIAEIQRERQDHADTMQMLIKEQMQCDMVVQQFVPPAMLHLIENQAVWDDATDRWRIRFSGLAGNNIQRQHQSIANELKTGLKVGVGHKSSGGDAGWDGMAAADGEDDDDLFHMDLDTMLAEPPAARGGAGQPGAGGAQYRATAHAGAGGGGGGAATRSFPPMNPFPDIYLSYEQLVPGIGAELRQILGGANSGGGTGTGTGSGMSIANTVSRSQAARLGSGRRGGGAGGSGRPQSRSGRPGTAGASSSLAAGSGGGAKGSSSSLGGSLGGGGGGGADGDLVGSSGGLAVGQLQKKLLKTSALQDSNEDENSTPKARGLVKKEKRYA